MHTSLAVFYPAMQFSKNDNKATLYHKMRKHVLDLAAKEANGKIEEFIITWPVNKYSAPLSVDPSVILGARRLEDVTWHDIPVRRWLLLTADEKTNLKEDIWFYSRTGLREDAARAATALADEIKAGRKVQGWPEGAGAGDDKSFASAIDMSGNLVATMTYSCSKCAVASSAVTGWDFKPSTHNQANRWGCKVCWQNWLRDTAMSIVIHVRSKDRSFSFFTRWPLSHTVKIEWPEVYYKATHFAVMRSTWYCKYDPFPELRDEPPSDDPKLRLKVADDIQRAIWNILLPDTAFSSDEVALKAAIREENSQRWLAYGPGAHGQDDETGVETYRSMRVEGYVGGSDAPEYEVYSKQMDKAKKKQKKHAASSLEPWALSG